MAVLKRKSRKNGAKETEAMMLDAEVPILHRKQMLMHLVAHGGEEGQEILVSILNAAANGDGDSPETRKARELDQLIQELQSGPLRCGTIVGTHNAQGPVARAVVRLEDGTTVFPILPDAGLASRLEPGVNVLLDAEGRAVFLDVPFEDGTGEEAILERRLGGECVEVTLQGDERLVVNAARPLVEALEREDVLPGSRLLICSRRRFAFRAIPSADGFARYRYLDRSPVPDVRLGRDLGAPHPFIAEAIRMVRIEMLHPEIRRRYHLRRCTMRLLAGLSGSGKSYSILALRRSLAEVMAEVTGVPLEALPPRVLRLRPAEVLSKYYGESDRNIARFFSEVEQLADQPFVAPDGREYRLPVLAILEEIDGLARTRGDDALHDRVLTTLLERLDATRIELRDRLILFVGTTNVASRVDPAFLRRIGGTVERFGRLERTAFRAVLRKHLAGIPIAAQNGMEGPERLAGLVAELTAWLYSPNGEDPGQAEIYYTGRTAPEIRYRRDFMTAGLVDRAVQQAAGLACEEEEFGTEHPGLTPAGLMAAFDCQIRGVVEQLCLENAPSHLELPEGQRLQRVMPIEAPAVRPFELMRSL